MAGEPAATVSMDDFLEPSSEDEGEGRRFILVFHCNFQAARVFQLCRLDEIAGPASVIAVGIAAVEIKAACDLLKIDDTEDLAFDVKLMSMAAAKWINDRRKK